ncbi:MAG: hypothetical protein GEV07_09010 [Streptosporangiales bacterium]|nr:hypothetical protein [Streptosporangiales bacterium]
MTSTATVLVVGDASLDTTVLVDQVPAPDEKVLAHRLVEGVGGVAANSAIAAAVAGAPVRLETALGQDTAAAECLRGLRAAGVDVRAEHDSDRTARALILLDGHGEKRLVLAPGSQFYPSVQRCGTLRLDGVGWMHTAAYDAVAARRLVDRCRQAAIPWSVDLEPATLGNGLAVLADVLRGAAVVFCNTRAAALLGQDAAEQLTAAGAQHLVMTAGPAGATLVTAGTSIRVEPPATAVDVVDTTGAGDCLAGSYVARTLHGDAAPDALAYAVAAASLSCAGLGAHPAYPTPTAVKARLSQPTEQRGAVGP